jgi:hypothetical protein
MLDDMTREASRVDRRAIAAIHLATQDNQVAVAFNCEAMTYRAHIFTQWVPTDRVSPERLGAYGPRIVKSDCRDLSGRDGAFLIRHDSGALTAVEFGGGWAEIRTASDDADVTYATTQLIAAEIRSSDNHDPATPITFWYIDQRSHAPMRKRRRIETQPWTSVAANYADTSRAGVGKLVELADCPDERMILWHGPSGTGKTHALRSLAREWREWCDVAFISDPEEFIGGAGTYSPSYLFEVTRDHSSHAGDQRRSTLIVLEDAGELMSAEASQHAGQGLSRLLNLTDGMLGQGLKVMVLITTNDAIGSLHPAVIRPGRMLAEIEFGALSPAEATEWLDRHGSPAAVKVPTPLAQLFAIASSNAAHTEVAPA